MGILATVIVLGALLAIYGMLFPLLHPWRFIRALVKLIFVSSIIVFIAIWLGLSALHGARS